MGIVAQQHFVITPDARYAMQAHGVPDPVAIAMQADIDVDALLETKQLVEHLRAQIAELCNPVGAAIPGGWGGGSCQAWNTCRVTFLDFLRWLLDALLYVVEILILIIDIVLEIVQVLAALVTWALTVLSVLGLFELIFHKRLGNAPVLVRRILALSRLGEKAGRNVVTIVEGVAILVANLEPWLDLWLDMARAALDDLRQRTAGCLGTAGPLPDEPIPHIPTPPFLPTPR